MTYSPDPYTAAAQYRQRIAELLAMAVTQFEGCLVEWKHAGIYASEMKDIPKPPFDVEHILAEGLAQLRGMVNTPAAEIGVNPKHT